MKKRIIFACALICVCMVALLGVATLNAPVLAESTTECTSTPCSHQALIDNTHYDTLAEAFDAAKTMSGDVTIQLLADVDLANWTAVDYSNTSFATFTFDGDKHTVNNLGQPLFNLLQQKTYNVKNVTFLTPQVVEVAGSQNMPCAGVIAPNFSNGGYFNIENVHISGGTITSASNYAGGFFGLAIDGATVLLKDCSVQDVKITSANSVGGLIGHNYSTLKVENTTVGSNELISTDDNPAKVGSLVGTFFGSSAIDATEISPSTGSYLTTTSIAGNLPPIGRLYKDATYVGGSYFVDPTKPAFVATSDPVPVVKGTFFTKENKYFVAKAVIDATNYTSVQDALDVATAGQTVTVLVPVTGKLAVNKNITLDFGENAFVGKISVASDVVLTINGTSADNDIVLLAPSKVGYAFDGWFTDEDLTIPATVVTANNTYYQKWIESKYTLDVDSLDFGTVTYGEQTPSKVVTLTATAIETPGITSYYGKGYFDANVTGLTVEITPRVDLVAGTHSETITIVTSDGAEHLVNVKVVVQKANPTFEPHADITTVGGNLLLQVGLSNGFAWVDETTKVACGLNEVAVTYTPQDVENYNVVTTTVKVTGNHVLSDVQSLAPTCVKTGLKDHYSCTNCNVYFDQNKVETTIEALTIPVDATAHNFGETTYTWAEDNSTCTATRICSHDNTHKQSETANAVVTVTQQRDCLVDEISAFAVTFQNTAFASQNKQDIKTADKFGHNYGDLVAKVDATCIATGTKEHYKCSLCNTYFDQNKVKSTVEALTIPVDATAHDFGEATYTWSQDNTLCTAIRACSHNPYHVEREIVGATKQVTQALSCTADEIVTMTATFTNNVFATQTKTNLKTASKIGHNYSIANDKENHWQLCENCGDVQNVEVHSYGKESCQVCQYKDETLIVPVVALGGVVAVELLLALCLGLTLSKRMKKSKNVKLNSVALLLFAAIPQNTHTVLMVLGVLAIAGLILNVALIAKIKKVGKAKSVATTVATQPVIPTVEKVVEPTTAPVTPATPKVEKVAPKATLPLSDKISPVELDADQIAVRYNRSFQAKIIQSDDDVKEFYCQIKNYVLSFAKVKCKGSWKAETFTAGRKLVAKLSFKGKTLLINLPLTMEDVADAKFKVLDMSDKKSCARAPIGYKIKSARSSKNAQKLVDKVVAMHNLTATENANPVSANQLPYQTTESLIAQGLVKVKSLNGQAITDGAKLVNTPFAIYKSITVEQAHEEISDEVAMTFAEKLNGEKVGGRKFAINIDTLGANFENGDHVDMQVLKEKGLVPKNAQAIKVLARGMLDKQLTVVADAYSADAIKMILLVGGKVIIK